MHVFYLTAENYPKIFEALETISHDSGGRAGHTTYCVPFDYVNHLKQFEVQLRRLTAEEFETFCIGEQSEAAKIKDRSLGFKLCDRFLNDFFDEQWLRW